MAYYYPVIVAVGQCVLVQYELALRVLSHQHFWCALGFNWRQSPVRLDDVNRTQVCKKKGGLRCGSCELQFADDINAIVLNH